MTIPFFHPKPAPPDVFGGQRLPHKQANLFSRLVFFCISPILKVGYSRPIESEDVWDLEDEYCSAKFGDRLQDQYQARLPPSMRTVGYRPKGPAATPNRMILFTPQHSTDELDEQADRMEVLAGLGDQPGLDGDALQLTAQLTRASSTYRSTNETAVPTVSAPTLHSTSASRPSLKKLVTRFGKRNAKKIQAGLYAVEDGKVYNMSLWRAMYFTAFNQFWYSAALLFVSYMLRIAVPLVAKVLIDEFTRAKAYNDAQEVGRSLDGLTAPKPLGFSFGIAVILFAMLGTSALFHSHAQQRWGLLALGIRAAITDLISRKTMRLSSKSREQFTAGRINTMVAADTSYCEWVVQDSIIFVVLFPQLIAGCGLLIWQLGPSALVALAILALSGPVQAIVFHRQMKNERQHQTIMDERVRLLTEVINHIREIKLYAYESLFGQKVEEKRNSEMKVMRSITTYNAISASLMFFIPTLAAIATFIVYSALGNPLDAGKIFLSLQLLNILRQPIAWFPRIISAFVDFLVATRRIGEMLQAEEDEVDISVNTDMSLAISMHGTFQYEKAFKKAEVEEKVSTTAKIEAKLSVLKERIKSPLNTPMPSQTDLSEEKPQEQVIKQPFTLKDIHLDIPRGALVCVVGRVGAGKSALLQSMINEVKTVSGDVTFCGPITYVPQHAWVQSGTIEANITFASDAAQVDAERVTAAAAACGLTTDLASLQAGVQTHIGERGITLSGGQKQRICIARAAYAESDIVLLDDPLSAVDAQVGHHILHQCILDGPLAKRTRILVTHHLDVLPLADIVLMVEGDSAEGKIVQQGSYQELRAVDGPFRSLIEDYGSKTSKETAESTAKEPAKDDKEAASAQGKQLHLDEDREKGSIPFSTYRLYASNMGHWSFVFVLAAVFITAQLASVVNILWLGWWAGNRFDNLSRGTYMGVYAAIGLLFAICLFSSTYLLAVLGLRASFKMFRAGWENVMRSPTTWHDRTPTGRIISRLSKDVNMMDYRVPSIIWSFLTNALVMVGTFGLVVYTYPYLGLAFIPVIVFIYITFNFFQQCSRELKRLDSVQRSFVYGNLAEQLSGVAVIKAFGKQGRFETQLQKSLDEHSKVYAARWYIQAWLNMRVALAGFVLVGAVAIFGIATRDNSDPYKFGVVFTYVISAAFVLESLIASLSQAEQEMNNVERVANYTQLPHEGDAVRPTDPPAVQWPSNGAISFQDVHLRYRPELPLVLKGLTFDIKPGEKVGIIGRTGAGKSSLVQALYRTVELTSGRIAVDGQDLAALGLETLRSRLSIIPQESFLFAGTVRENIDPAGCKPDHELNNCLSLIHNNPAASSSLRDKFRLETTVQNEGANFSAGERQLLALMRALVRGCKILVLDEATSSVDPETDALIQRIIQAEFSNVTLISIAHRLQTVAYYDRILVMDAGIVAEFDTPLALYDNPESIFRSLCDTKQLSREDLVRIQTDAAVSLTA